jgi:hypothetical protein
MEYKDIIDYQYTVINKYTWHPEQYNKKMKILKTIHNAGFFSCCSIRLLDIMVYFNQNSGLPDMVDSTEQFGLYKGYSQQNLIPFYFMEKDDYAIPYSRIVEMTYAKEEPQFSDYKQICFTDTQPFIEKYFTPSFNVGDFAYMLGEKYELDYENVCAVFYRGNDKSRETTIASYNVFIDKAKEIKQHNPLVKFLVQPDETEFLIEFCKAFPNDTIWFTETPHMPKKDSCMFFELPQVDRAEYGAKYFGAVLVLAKCKHMIIHSGNGAFWSVLYRGNTNNVHQFLNNKWL